MNEIHRKRTIRPSTRKPESTYKVDTANITQNDVLIVEIDNEETSFNKRYWFDGSSLKGRSSIHFSAKKIDGKIVIKWYGVKSRLIPPLMTIKLRSEWFEMGYYVYVVIMQRGYHKLFYVGMTGDRKHETARSPFYRMSGHFSLLEKSTQNHVIQALRHRWPEKNIQDLLLDTSFSYYAYKMIPFHRDDMSKHARNRTFAEAVESGLIKKLKDAFGEDKVFNKRISNKNYTDADDITSEIFKELKQYTRDI